MGYDRYSVFSVLRDVVGSVLVSGIGRPAPDTQRDSRSLVRSYRDNAPRRFPLAERGNDGT
jgi:hypothetical protein